MKVKCGHHGEFELVPNKTIVRSNGVVASILGTTIQVCTNEKYHIWRTTQAMISETTWKRIKKYFKEIDKSLIMNAHKEDYIKYYIFVGDE